MIGTAAKVEGLRRAGWGRLVRARVRERAFWAVQGGVLAVIGLHLLAEASPLSGPGGHLAYHHIPVALYIVPIAYASLRYGLEGGLLTGLWCALLSVPNIVIWHRSGFEWLGELVFVAVVLGAGVAMAVPVDRERSQRRRAEATSSRLRLLNEIATLVNGDDLEATLEAALTRLVGVTGVAAACVVVTERDDEGLVRVAVRGCHAVHPEDGSRLKRAVTSGSDPEVVVVPMGIGDGSQTEIAGHLGVLPGDGQSLTLEDHQLLTAVSGQLGMTIEQTRLHQLEKDYLRAYAQRVTQAQEEERRRISLDLHDETTQNLILLRGGLDELTDRREDGQSVAELHSLVETTLEGLRRLTRNLRPPMLDDLGLVAAMEWMTSDLAERGGVEAVLRVEGVPRRLAHEAELTLFRIGQEALHNVVRHAEASRATVTIDFAPDQVTVVVDDDGRGFDPPATPVALARSGKLGLVGMQERARLLGGSLQVDSGPGAGTRVSARLPV